MLANQLPDECLGGWGHLDALDRGGHQKNPMGFGS